MMLQLHDDVCSVVQTVYSRLAPLDLYAIIGLRWEDKVGHSHASVGIESLDGAAVVRTGSEGLS